MDIDIARAMVNATRRTPPSPVVVVPPSQVVLPAIFRCRLTHSRRQGVRHTFRHTVYLWLTDIDDLPSLRWPLTRLARFDPA